MTAHPLSLRKQISLLFPEVEKVRFESHGPYRTIYYVKLWPCEEPEEAIRARIRKYLSDNRPIGVVAALSDEYVEGNLWPHTYSLFSLAELGLIDACRMNQEGLGASLQHAFREIKSAAVTAKDPLTVKIQVQSPAVPALETYKAFIHACLNNPDLSLVIQIEHSHIVGTGSFLSKKTQQHLDEDKELYRSFCTGYFRSERSAINARFSQHRFACYKHMLSTLDDIRLLLPFYDRVFVHAPEMAQTLDRHGKFFGMTRPEAFALINSGVVVPILQHPLDSTGEHLGTLAEILDSGQVVLPWELAESTAVRLLADAPLWALAQSDASLASHALRVVENELGKAVSNNSMESQTLAALIRHTRKGCIDFRSHLIAHPFRLANALGLASMLLDSDDARKVNLPAVLAGLEADTAAALGASWLPAQELRPWCDNISALREGAAVGSIEQLSVSSALEVVVAELELSVPEGMSVLEWSALLDEVGVKQVRKVVSGLFADMVLVDDRALFDVLAADARTELDRIQEEVSVAIRHRKKATTVMAAGVLGDAITYMTGTSLPFLATGISAFSTLVAPSIRAMILDNEILREVAAHLEAFSLRTSVRATRLLHLREQLNRAKSRK